MTTILLIRIVIGHLPTYEFFGLVLYVPVNSYVGTVSSPNLTFFMGKLDEVVNQYFVHIL